MTICENGRFVLPNTMDIYNKYMKAPVAEVRKHLLDQFIYEYTNWPDMPECPDVRRACLYQCIDYHEPVEVGQVRSFILQRGLSCRFLVVHKSAGSSAMCICIPISPYSYPGTPSDVLWMGITTDWTNLVLRFAGVTVLHTDILKFSQVTGTIHTDVLPVITRHTNVAFNNNTCDPALRRFTAAEIPRDDKNVAVINSYLNDELYKTMPVCIDSAKLLTDVLRTIRAK